MPAERFPPDDPREWLNRARSNLAKANLSDYAVETRYPGLSEPVAWQEYQEAITIAEEVVRWAQSVLDR